MDKEAPVSAGVEVSENQALAARLVVGDLPAAARICRRLTDEKNSQVRHHSPILAVLVIDEVETKDRAAALQAQRDCLTAGANDVIAISSVNVLGLPLAVDMAIAQLEAKQAAEKAMAQRIVAECKAEVREVIKLLEQRRSEPPAGLYWQSVHKLFQNFPQLCLDLDAAPCVGSCIGPRKLERELGHGGFGAVFLAKNLDTGEAEAVKILSKASLCDTRQVTNAWREMSLLRKLEHEHIAALTTTYHGPGHIFICMELAGQGHLANTIFAGARRRLGVVRSRAFQGQLLSGLAHLEERNIAHRDMKPENIAVSADGARIKIIDLGSCAYLGRPCDDMVGTMPFIPPEVLACGNTECYVPSGCDVWAAGVVLLEMLCGLGKFSRMLNWNADIRPTPHRSRELQEYFQDYRPMYEALVEDLGQDEVTDELMQLSVGSFQLILKYRWSAAEARRCDWLAVS